MRTDIIQALRTAKQQPAGPLSPGIHTLRKTKAKQLPVKLSEDLGLKSSYQSEDGDNCYSDMTFHMYCASNIYLMICCALFFAIASSYEPSCIYRLENSKRKER